MPIRHFEFYANERKLASVDTVSHLRGLRIGIDGTHWLRRILYGLEKEPLVMAMGGIPLALRQAIDQELLLLKKSEIHALFVFPGIPQPWRKEAAFSTEDRRPSVRQQGWEAFQQGRSSMASSMWTNAGFVPQAELLHLVFALLQKHGLEFVRAPYGVHAQLAYWDKSPRGYFHAVYASNDYLLYDVDRLITAIDFNEQKFTWMEKKRVLQDLSVNADQFLDIGLLAGCEFMSTFPPLSDTPGGFSYRASVDLVRSHPSGLFAVQNYGAHPAVVKMHYPDLFVRTRTIIRHHLVLKDDGTVGPLNPESAPNDLHELVGPRFPLNVYHSLMQCLISPQALNCFSTGTMLSVAPLCNGESAEYQRFVKSEDFGKHRAMTLRILAKALGPSFEQKPVNLHYWFEPEKEYTIAHSAEPIPNYFWNWTVPAEISTDKQDITILYCLSYLSKPAQAKQTVKMQPPESVPRTKNAMLFLALCRLLELTGYVSWHTHLLTQRGTAFYEGLLALMKQEPKEVNDMASALWLAFMLVPSGCLSSKRFSVGYDLSQSTGIVLSYLVTGPDCRLIELMDQHILLVSRVLSLLQAKYLGDKPWSGPLSRDLLAAHSFGKSLSMTVHSLGESVLLTQFVCSTGKMQFTAKEKKEWTSLGLALPFNHDGNTAVGLLVRIFLESLKAPDATRAKALEHSQSVMGECFQPSMLAQELKRGLAFWNAVMTMMETSVSIPKEMMRQFLAANEWLKKVGAI